MIPVQSISKEHTSLNFLFVSLSNYVTVSGAVFILYNYARVAAILRQFEEKVQLGYYPQLIPFEEVDFLLLSKEVSYLSFLNCIESVSRNLLH
jgi:arginyl-tRNA synthetase